MTDTDFVASGVDPVEFKAMTPAAKRWIADTGKAEPNAADRVRRDKASALIFLDALTRRGFTCVDAKGAAMRPPVPQPDNPAHALIGCGAIIGVAGLFALWASGIFDSKPEAPVSRPRVAQAPTCDLPNCVDPARAGFITAGLDAASIVKRTPADFGYVKSVAYQLPSLERRDEYEPTVAFRQRIEGKLNSWSIGAFGPKTQMLVKDDDPITTDYNADRGRLSLYDLDRPSSVTIGKIDQTDTTTDTASPHDIKVRERTTSSDHIFFVNTVPLAFKGKIDNCSVDYDRIQKGSGIAFPMAPNEARKIADKLHFYYIVSFTAPSNAKGRAWCYTGSDGTKTPMLIPGGMYQDESRTNYVHMHLHQIIVSDGSKVYWSKSYN